MHIKFDLNKISFEYVRLKSVNAMTGFITVVDEYKGKERTRRLDCPNSVLRLFSKTYKASQFVIPQETCIMLYEQHIIAIEKSITNDRYIQNFDGSLSEWEPDMKRVYQKVLNLMNPKYDWYFDGSYLYSFFDSFDLAVSKGKHLTEDGKFRAIHCKSIFINYIGFTDDVYVEDRQCLSYVIDGVYSISTPIWKTLANIGESNMKKKADSNEVINLESQFDKVDNNMLVNLQFAIMAGINLSRRFGYQIIEPLQLPRLLVQLRTVNLQSVPTGTKQTFDIGLKFTQAMAWLLGIHNTHVKNYDDMLVMKKLFRYLSTTGIYSKSSIKNIYKDEEVPLMDLTQLRAMA